MPITAQPEMTNPDAPQGAVLFGCPEGQDARVLANLARDLAREKKILTHIALDDTRAAALIELLTFFAPEVEAVYYPAWDCLPYDRVSPNAEIVAGRVNALSRLIEWRASNKFLPRILITTVNGAMQRVMPRSALEKSGFSARVGERVALPALQEYLVSNGYMRTDTVREHGEFAIRGGIVDLFPPGEELPVRIDLFGDEVESIRSFDPATQRTENKKDAFSLRPVTEFFLDQDSIAKFRGGYRETFGAVLPGDPLYEAVSEGRRYNGMDHWLPLFFDKMDTIFDYVPETSVTTDQNVAQSAAERLAQVKDFYEARKTLEDSFRKKGKKKDSDVSMTGAVYHPLPPHLLYLRESETAAVLENAVELLPFGAPDAPPLIPQQAGGDERSERGGSVSIRDGGGWPTCPPAPS